MIEYGPHSGDSHSRFGFSFLNLSSAKRQPDGFDKSKSFIVQRSTFRLAPSAVFVSCEVGSQNTSTKSVCFSSFCINMAISVLSSLCQFSFSLVSHLPMCGGSGWVGSGAVTTFFCSVPVFRRRIPNPVPLHSHNHKAQMLSLYLFFVCVLWLVSAVAGWC